MYVGSSIDPPHCLLFQATLYQCLFEDLTWESVKCLTEVSADNVDYSPLAYQPSHFITEVSQFGQLYLGENVLTTPDGFLVFHVPGNGVQN